MKVPWLPREEIASKAQELLADYEHVTGIPVTPPIPVDDIIERYLELKLQTVDFEGALGMKNVLGATYVKARLICVDENLIISGSEGRLYFTCAHEVGHWVLHRQFAAEANRSGDPSIICRTAEAKEPIEWQADYFATCLLMPEKEVTEAFRSTYHTDAIVLDNVKSSLGCFSLCFDPCAENWPIIAEYLCQRGGFTNVSKQAAIIRLQELGLVVNNTGMKLGWA